MCNTAAPILLNSVTEELRTLLVCDAFDELKIQEKAALVFTAGKDVSSVFELSFKIDTSFIFFLILHNY